MTTFPLTTTLNRIHGYPYYSYGDISGWEEVEEVLAATGKDLPGDKPITYAKILDAVGLERALWACRAEPQHARLWRLYAIWCAKSVQVNDPQLLTALDVAERHANGLATESELIAVWFAARATGRGAGAFQAAARATAWDAARDAASHAAEDVAWIVAKADWGRIGAWDAAKSAERQAQAAAFRQLVTTGTLP